jgi:hypothetical protein
MRSGTPRNDRSIVTFHPRSACWHSKRTKRRRLACQCHTPRGYLSQFQTGDRNRYPPGGSRMRWAATKQACRCSQPPSITFAGSSRAIRARSVKTICITSSAKRSASTALDLRGNAIALLVIDSILWFGIFKMPPPASTRSWVRNRECDC